MKSKTGIEIVLVINKAYVDAIDALRAFARKETKELKSPVMRFLQIEEWARKNLQRESNQVLQPTGAAIPVSSGM